MHAAGQCNKTCWVCFVGVFCGLVKTLLNLSARAVVTHPVLQGALSRCLPSSCGVLFRAAVEAWLWVGFGLKQGTQSFGAGRLPLRENIHGATPAQAQAASPQGNVLLALPLLRTTIHKAW